ncbi:hypothetical protein NM688_g7567 [Phlebia brevispora]|uniref:Uncharacterized protein n=1 Tax=Phlebia brevispora TaxID=194682 RepID=A0ACC1S3R8_9APHY|nr:hypothetical protein NM688_g7567 [Phlebia brevispora]
MDNSLYTPQYIPHQEYTQKFTAVPHVIRDYSSHYRVEEYPYPSTLLQQHNEYAAAAYSSDYGIRDYVQPSDTYPPPPYEPPTDYLPVQIYPEVSEPAVQIHAPIPISAYSTLLPAIQDNNPTPQPAPGATAGHASSSQVPRITVIDATPEDVKPYNPVDYYANVPQTTFPTPCELLISTQTHTGSTSFPPQNVSADIPPEQQPSTPSTPFSPSPSGDFEHEPSTPVPEMPGQASPQSVKKPENQRKAYFRSVAGNVGFQLTDPDSISSHDKKRYYLECMEKYVRYLEERVSLAGVEPLPMKRVHLAHGGLDIRSIRTMFVYMQSKCRSRRQDVLTEERLYLELERQVLELEKSTEPRETEAPTLEAPPPPAPPVGVYADKRRHSIASGMIPMNGSWHTVTVHPVQAHV